MQGNFAITVHPSIQGVNAVRWKKAVCARPAGAMSINCHIYGIQPKSGKEFREVARMPHIRASASTIPVDIAVEKMPLWTERDSITLDLWLFA